MSDNQEIQSTTLTPLGNIIGGIGAGSFIINDYLLTISESTGGYILNITKGSQTQTAFIRDAVSIESIEQIVTSEEDEGLNTIRIILSDGSSHDFNYINGSKGNKGDPGLTSQERQTILDAESARNNAESLRIEAESDRVENERDRILYETIRRGEEAERVQKEKNRVSAETARVSAESARVAAEKVRKQNEDERNQIAVERYLDWQDLKTQFNAAINTITLQQGEINQVSDKVDVAADEVVEARVEVNDLLTRAEGSLEQLETVAENFSNLSVQTNTLPSGSNATGIYADGVFTFGIPRGEKGEHGDAFHIVKTYSSIEEMNSDYSGTDVNVGEFVMIVSSVEDEDNAKVFIKGNQQYDFIVNMSGATGINGVGIENIAKTGTSGLVDTYTITYTNNTTSTFTVTNGSAGQGLPSGGSEGQFVKKKSNADYDFEYSTLPVTDVQIDNTSIVSNGVASIPVATEDQSGVVKTNYTYGVYASKAPSDLGMLYIQSALPADSKVGLQEYRPITPSVQHAATFYGLATAAGDGTQTLSPNAIGTYTNGAKDKIQQMLGVDALIAYHEYGGVASVAHDINDMFIMNGKLYRATANIAFFETIAEGINCAQVNVANAFIKNTDYGSTTNAGIFSVGSGLSVSVLGALNTDPASSVNIKQGTNTSKPITSDREHEAVFYGLAKAAGDTSQASSANAVGTYTDDAKNAIKSMLGVSDDVIESEVDSWLEDHPEAVTTVQDGAITYNKLHADLKNTVDDVDELKSAIDGITKKMTPVYSENVWNPSEEKAGYFVGTNGSEGTGDSYTCYSEPIPVEPGDVVRFYRLDGSAFAAANVRFICAYDENGDAVSASGVNGDTNSYTVPSGIYFINPTHYSRWTKRMMTINYEATDFIDYVGPYYVAGDGFVEYAATSGDIGKAFSPKTVEDGKVTEWQYVEAGGDVVIDDTLSNEGEAADAKATGDALATKVNTGLMQYCDVATVPGSKNLWNPAIAESGFIGTNGVISSSTSYCYNYIEVTPGDVVYASVAGTALNMRFICAYNENDEAVSASGSGSDTNGFTVPSGIVKLAITIGSAQKDTGMVILNDSNVPSAYIPYAPLTQAYVAKQEFLQNVNAMTEESFKSEYMEDIPKNILNPEDAVTKKLIIYNSGALTDNNDYYTTGYMPVVAGKTYYFWSNKLERKGGRAIAGFNSSKTNVGTAGINDGTASIYSYTVPAGIAYIRVSFAYRADDVTFTPAGNMAIATAVPMEFMAYDGTEDYVFKSEIIPYDTPNLHVYLPPEICVGIGRTIELYNELVCLEADKYHLHYICAKGVQYGRKWSLTGATAGSYPLTLQIYDDNMKMVWTGTTTVKVVANSISSQLKVLPIGDSLTNLKSWIGEVQTLSNDKIIYIGTRGRGDLSIRCEGRSGFTAADYNADTEYTFDNNYQGNPNVSGSANPFWDGSKFSLSYYNTQQAATVGTADAVQLFLGTNDVFGGFTAEESAQHIKDLVDAIRDEFASIPIFVCNTIYRSNQSGYYSSGGQGFSAASGWAFDSDMKIMDFQNALTDALKSYTNLYIVPLSVCMDREYDFGVNEVDVNPRLSTVKEIIPTESVHPQDPGYYQMADVMYSSYIAHLS